MTWQQIRLQVLERDGYVCQHCGHTNKLDVHHIIPKRLGGLDVLNNLVSLCADKCHTLLELSKQQQQKREPTSLNIDPELWREVRKMAIDKGITATEYFEQALREKLTRDKAKK